MRYPCFSRVFFFGTVLVRRRVEHFAVLNPSVNTAGKRTYLIHTSKVLRTRYIPVLRRWQKENVHKSPSPFERQDGEKCVRAREELALCSIKKKKRKKRRFEKKKMKKKRINGVGAAASAT